MIFNQSIFIVGPLISQAEAWKAEALIRYSVIKTSVCLCVSVCPQATGHRFWPRNLFFWHNTPWAMRKKCFSKFWCLALWGLCRPFSSIFLFILCKSSVRAIKSHRSTYKLDFWHIEYMTPLRVVFSTIFEICISAPLGALLFSKRALKAKRHNCEHIDIVYWLDFYEFRGPFKRGPKGPLRAKIRSFGDRNIILYK